MHCKQTVFMEIDVIVMCTGDRIISVNGETITGRTYAQVVQLIQQSGNFLHLFVVPKEDDILQLVSCSPYSERNINIVVCIYPLVCWYKEVNLCFVQELFLIFFVIFLSTSVKQLITQRQIDDLHM
jgi:hypothetical protein